MQNSAVASAVSLGLGTESEGDSDAAGAPRKLDYAGPTVEAVERVPVMAPAGPSLRSRTIRGSAWTMGGYGAGQVLRFASNLILTRLLAPEMFGLMALVSIFM